MIYIVSKLYDLHKFTYLNYMLNKVKQIKIKQNKKKWVHGSLKCDTSSAKHVASTNACNIPERHPTLHR